MKKNRRNSNTISQFQWEQLHGLLRLAQHIARSFRPRDETIIGLIDHIQKANVTAHGVIADEPIYYVPIRVEERWGTSSPLAHGATLQERV